MADLNCVVLTGRSTKDAVPRTKASGQMKGEFSFEVDRPFYRVTGEPVSDLFLVDVWGDLGRWAVENVKAGSRLVVVGTLNKESYLTRGGREHLTVIKAKAVRLLDGSALDGQLDVEAIKEDAWGKDTLSRQMDTIKQIVDI